jgi:hypothetical protein
MGRAFTREQRGEPKSKLRALQIKHARIVEDAEPDTEDQTPLNADITQMEEDGKEDGQAKEDGTEDTKEVDWDAWGSNANASASAWKLHIYMGILAYLGEIFFTGNRFFVPLVLPLQSLPLGFYVVFSTPESRIFLEAGGILRHVGLRQPLGLASYLARSSRSFLFPLLKRDQHHQMHEPTLSPSS